MSVKQGPVEELVDQISQGDLEILAATRGGPKLSLYFAPSDDVAEQANDALRFRHLVDQGRQQLIEHGAHEAEIVELLQPLYELIENSEFWSLNVANGIAAFPKFSPELRYPIYRLPYKVQNAVETGECYFLTPLLRLTEHDRHFLLLSLSLNNVKLFECHADSVVQSALPENAAASLDEYLAGTEVGPPIRFSSSVPSGLGGDQVGLVHGQTSYKDDHKMRVGEYVTMLGRLFAELLMHRRMPLIIAGVDQLQAAFREACQSSWLVGNGISGSVDHLSEQQLHHQALPKFTEWRERRFADFNGRFTTRASHGRASERIETIVMAAVEGRVDSLVVEEEARMWGEFDRQNQAALPHAATLEGDIDLINLAVCETLTHGGQVHVVAPGHLPDEAQVAAVFRW